MEILNLDGEILATGLTVNAILEAETSSRVHPLRRKSFKRADLRDLDLDSAVICASNNQKSSRRSDFMGADFSGSKLKGVNFSGLDLRGANFAGCDLRDTSFVVCDLTGVCFDDVDASAFTDAYKTGRSTWFMDCILDQVRATSADFREAHIGAISATRAVFHDCVFEDAGFNGDWDGATFLHCNLEDSNPGSYLASVLGARFGVSLLHCNTKDILLKGCPTTPTTLPDDYVETPDVAWDKDGFEVEGMDDAFDLKRKAAESIRNAGRVAMMARYQALADKILAQDAIRDKARRVARNRHIGDRRRQVRLATKKVANLCPLEGSFTSYPKSIEGAVFKIQVAFNQPLSVGYATIRDHGFTVLGGYVTGARRVDGRSDRWEIKIRKDGGTKAITITSTAALKAKGNRGLSSPISTTMLV